MIATTPAPGQTLPGTITRLTVVFDQDMAVTAASDPGSVLNPANYAVFNAANERMAIRAISYDAASRTVSLSVLLNQADDYLLRVSSQLQSDRGVRLEQSYDAYFTTLFDYSQIVSLAFESTRFDRQTGTVSYDVRVTNISPDDLRAPLTLVLDPSQFFRGTPIGGVLDDGLWLIDLGAALGSQGVLKSGQSTSAQTVSIAVTGQRRADLSFGIYALPTPNAPPTLEEPPPLNATVGRLFTYQAVGADPDGTVLGYVLMQKPEGMTVDATTGLIRWTPAESSPAAAQAVLRVYDRRGGYAETSLAITVAGGNRAPSVGALDASYTIAEGAPFELSLVAADPDFDQLIYFADNLPAGPISTPWRGR